MKEPKSYAAFNAAVFIFVFLGMFSTITLDVVRAVKLLLDVAFLYNCTLNREIPILTETLYIRALRSFEPLAELAEQRGYPAKRMDKNKMTKEEIRHMLSVIIEPLLFYRTGDELSALENSFESGNQLLAWPIKDLETLVKLWTGEQSNPELLDQVISHHEAKSRAKLVKHDSNEFRAKLDDKMADTVVLYCSGHTAALTETSSRKNVNRFEEMKKEGELLLSGNDKDCDEATSQGFVEWNDGASAVDWDITTIPENRFDTVDTKGTTEWNDEGNEIEWEMMPATVIKQGMEDHSSGPLQSENPHCNRGESAVVMLNSEKAKSSASTARLATALNRTRTLMAMPMHFNDIFGVESSSPALTGLSLARDDKPHTFSRLRGFGLAYNKEISDLTNGDEDSIKWSMINPAKAAHVVRDGREIWWNLPLETQPEGQRIKRPLRMKGRQLSLDYAEETYDVISPLAERSQGQRPGEMLSNVDHTFGVNYCSPTRFNGRMDTHIHHLGQPFVPPTPLKHNRRDSAEFLWTRCPSDSPSQTNCWEIQGNTLAQELSATGQMHELSTLEDDRYSYGFENWAASPMAGADEIISPISPAASIPAASTTPIGHERHEQYKIRDGTWIPLPDSPHPDQGVYLGFDMDNVQSPFHGLRLRSDFVYFESSSNQGEPSGRLELFSELLDFHRTSALLPSTVDTYGIDTTPLPPATANHNRTIFSQGHWTSPYLADPDSAFPSLEAPTTTSYSAPDDVWAGHSARSIEEITDILELSQMPTRTRVRESSIEADFPTPTKFCDTLNTRAPIGHALCDSSTGITTHSNADHLLTVRKPGFRDLRPNGPVPKELKLDALEQRILDDSVDLASEATTPSLIVYKHSEAGSESADSPTTSDMSLPTTPLEPLYGMSKVTEAYCNEMDAYWLAEARDKWTAGLANWSEDDLLPCPKRYSKQVQAEEPLEVSLDSLGPSGLSMPAADFILPLSPTLQADGREPNPSISCQTMRSELSTLGKGPRGAGAATIERSGPNTRPTGSDSSQPLPTSNSGLLSKSKATETYINEMTAYWEAEVQAKWQAGIAQWNEEDAIGTLALQARSTWKRNPPVARQGGRIGIGGAVMRAKAALGFLTS